MLNFLGNLIWILGGGLICCLLYWLGGILLCLTIVGIPFGVQCFKLGTAILAPFGREIHPLPGADSPLRVVFNIIWILTAGWSIALTHIGSAVGLFLTIVGIPFALQHIKLVPLSLFPFGRDFR